MVAQFKSYPSQRKRLFKCGAPLCLFAALPGDSRGRVPAGGIRIPKDNFSHFFGHQDDGSRFRVGAT
jgi:hypothetical protein